MDDADEIWHVFQPSSWAGRSSRALMKVIPLLGSIHFRALTVTSWPALRASFGFSTRLCEVFVNVNKSIIIPAILQRKHRSQSSVCTVNYIASSSFVPTPSHGPGFVALVKEPRPSSSFKSEPFTSISSPTETTDFGETLQLVKVQSKWTDHQHHQGHRCTETWYKQHRCNITSIQFTNFCTRCCSCQYQLHDVKGWSGFFGSLLWS